MEKSFDELKKEATDLGLDLSELKSKAKLQAAIDKFYDNASQDADIAKEKIEEDVIEPKQKLNKKDRLKQLVKEARKAAFKKRKVIITNNDKRDSHMTTTAYLAFENQYFEKALVVPLDEVVELEQGLIDCAKASKIVHHVDEVLNGKRTGNKVPKLVKKYGVSYEE